MAQKKESAYQSWDEINQELKRLAELYTQRQKIEGKMNTSINKIKEHAEGQTSEILTEIKKIEKNIELFALQHRDEFTKKRTKKLNFGTISFRMTKKIWCPEKDIAIKSLKALNLDEYIRINESLDKDALLNLDEITLGKAGITIKREDKVSIEPNYIELMASSAD